MTDKSNKRLWEIDFLRGIAIVMMIIFHILYDLNYFDIVKLSLYSGLFLLFVSSIGITFLILVGISLTLSYSRVKDKLTERQLHLKFLTRGLYIFGLGLIITIVSWLFLGKGFIVFGVLHCIGISIILAYPFLKFRYLNLFLGLILIFFGFLLKNYTFDFYWLFWLGFIPSHFYTVDYFPLLPWFGFVLVGIFLGNSLYPDFKRVFRLEDLSKFRVISFFSYLGRHSLFIYFVHQPILLSIIYLFFMN